jgi:hypothetical protein
MLCDPALKEMEGSNSCVPVGESFAGNSVANGMQTELEGMHSVKGSVCKWWKSDDDTDWSSDTNEKRSNDDT